MKAVGVEGSAQGGAGTSVDVSGDGKTVIVCYYDAEEDVRGTACLIDVPHADIYIRSVPAVGKRFPGRQRKRIYQNRDGDRNPSVYPR